MYDVFNIQTFSVISSIHHSWCFRLCLVLLHMVKVKEEEKSICLLLCSCSALKCFLGDLMKVDSSKYTRLHLKHTESLLLTPLEIKVFSRFFPTTKSNFELWSEIWSQQEVTWDAFWWNVNHNQTSGSILDTSLIANMTGPMNHMHIEDFKAFNFVQVSRVTTAV